MFQARIKNENNLKRYEQIIKEGLPSSIIVSRGEEIVFFIEKTRRHLNIENEEPIDDQIIKISLMEENYNHFASDKDDLAKFIDYKGDKILKNSQNFKHMLKEEMKKSMNKSFTKLYGV